MKNYFYTLITLLVLQQSFGQEKYQFNFQYSPNSTYTMTSESLIEGEINFKGNDSIMEAMKSTGMQLPMMMQVDNDMEISVQTKSRNADLLPIEMEIIKATNTTSMNGSELSTPPNPMIGQKFYATQSADGSFSIDSIPNTDLPMEIKNSLETTLSQLQVKFDIPKEGLSVGESFTQNIPMNFPLNGPAGNMDMEVNIVYTLKEVRDSMATFEVQSELTMSSDSDDMQMNASGQGPGTLLFDLENQIMSSYESELPIHMELEIQNGVMMDMKMNTKSIVRIARK